MDVRAGKVIGVVAADLERSPIGTRSRLLERLGGRTVLERTVGRVLAVGRVEGVVVLAGRGQVEAVRPAVAGLENRKSNSESRKIGDGWVEVMETAGRPEVLGNRVRAARVWGLTAWRGGAGQWTVFDEDYDPAGVWGALARFGGGGADGAGAESHALCVPAHAGLVDGELLGALVEHHLQRNVEMGLTFTPAAPGLCGLAVRGQTARELAELGMLPGQALAYDPERPGMDTLTRDACMQVDPALSKVPNRFLLDTQRGWEMTGEVVNETLINTDEHRLGDGEGRFGSLAELAGWARERALGFGWPREVEMELIGRRVTQAVGAAPAEIREARREMAVAQWEEWFAGGMGPVADDVCLTVGGDGDPLLYEGLMGVLRAARRAGLRNIHVQTDLAEGCEQLLEAVGEGLVDVVSVMFYGDDEETYQRVGGVRAYGRVRENLQALLAAVKGGLPLVVPRLLKVRETIPQMEAFFDRGIRECGWAVLDGPTDRAGAVAFAGVVDMGPPRRKGCRRIAERLAVRCDGVAVACLEDCRGRLVVGDVRKDTLEGMWRSAAFGALRARHAAGDWGEVCGRCREWFRA